MSISPETIDGLKRSGALSRSTRLVLLLYRIVTWRHPRCVNCQDTDRERLERHPSGLWACTTCAARWKYRNRPLLADPEAAPTAAGEE